MIPRKLASRKNAVSTSYPRSGPEMLPVFSMNPGQFVPNWKLITMPDTTPSANVRANTLVQK